MTTSGDPHAHNQHHLNHLHPLHHHQQQQQQHPSHLAAAESSGLDRRMSDPVRPLDRNYGVGGQLSRHRSYGNLQGGAAPGRMPLHQQRVRGQEGSAAAAGFMGDTAAQQAQQQVRWDPVCWGSVTF